MRERWKRAFLIFSTFLAVIAALAAYTALMTEIGAFTGHYVGLAIVCLVAYLAGVKLIERRVPSELFSRHALPAFVGGLLAGAVLFCMVMTALWITGVYQPQGLKRFGGLGLAAVFWFAVGAQEEILFRGLLFRLCSKVVGTWGALVVSAAIFGAVHFISPGWTLVGLLSVALAGVMLGAAYTATEQLWLPIGLHTGWNFTQGSLFGFHVSGNDIGSGLIAGKVDGPDILTGGPFGPEASIVTLIILLAATTYLLRRIVRLGRAELPVWSAAKEVPGGVPHERGGGVPRNDNGAQARGIRRGRLREGRGGDKGNESD